MSVTSATLRGRVAAERLMVDTCVIRRGATATTNPATGVVTQTWTQVYTGPCKLGESSGFGASGSSPEAGEHEFAVQGWKLHVPMSATAPREGDFATITAAALDPSLVGRVYRLGAEFSKTFATARRFEVEETLS